MNSYTAHSIGVDKIEALILEAVRRLSRFVLKDEEAFALELQTLWSERQDEKLKQSQSEFRCLKKRYDKLSTLIRGLYENLVLGMLPEGQYKILMKQYDEEQAEIEKKMENIQKSVNTTKNKTQRVDIYFNYVGKVNLAYTDKEMEGEEERKRQEKKAHELERQR